MHSLFDRKMSFPTLPIFLELINPHSGLLISAIFNWTFGFTIQLEYFRFYFNKNKNLKAEIHVFDTNFYGKREINLFSLRVLVPLILKSITWEQKITCNTPVLADYSDWEKNGTAYKMLT